jgi:predicted nucleic acid-binding protein
MIRAVLDTNILVSAAITPKGHSDQIIAQAEAGAFSWLTSEFILTELINVLGRKHIQSK